MLLHPHAQSFAFLYIYVARSAGISDGPEIRLVGILSFLSPELAVNSDKFAANIASRKVPDMPLTAALAKHSM